MGIARFVVDSRQSGEPIKFREFGIVVFTRDLTEINTEITDVPGASVGTYAEALEEPMGHLLDGSVTQMDSDQLKPVEISTGKMLKLCERSR